MKQKKKKGAQAIKRAENAEIARQAINRAGRRAVYGFETRKDGSLIIYVAWPDHRGTHWYDGEPIRVEPHQVSAALAACGDALAKKKSVRA